jgi:tetratricopeptide (TPR) repeat protein
MQKLPLDATAWAELSELLDAALERPMAGREAWLEALAPRFDSLKPYLRELLSRAAMVESQQFMSALPRLDMEADQAGHPAAREERAGDVIGTYRLVRELGSGGMGSVWLAERIDGLISRPVALKLPLGAWKRAGLAERMARERDILATLAHPNIAHLYDAGLTADGQPWLAIEYVEGRRLDEYCSERQLDPKAQLRLFAQVAAAVAYAHSKLVVHRDLKPANILVTDDGQVRLLDFGIAKLLDEGQARETKLTEMSGRALTPDYASPEQIIGEPLTIASDIYSLGVILYELLSGQRPYKLQRDSRGALEEAIVQTEPASPSEVVDRQHRRTLRGDLDTIVLKALKKKPHERYPTVHALLEDIERYLGGRPVLAQPDSAWYRFRKFISRNRLAAGATAAVFVALVFGASIALWQARVALAEKARAEEVQEFIASVFREADPSQGQGRVLSAVELLRQAEQRLRDRTDASPELRLVLLTIIGESLFGLQENRDSARVIEEALRLQGSLESREPLVDARLHLALSRAYEYLGRNEDAMAELSRSLTILQASRLTTNPVFVQVKLHEAAMGQALADYTLASKAARESIAAASALIGPRSAEVATGLQLLSQANTFLEQREQAMDNAGQAYAIMLDLHHGDTSHPKVIDSAMYYGRALQFGGDFERAYQHIRRATDDAARVFGSDSRMEGELLGACVLLEIERGDLRRAVASARRSVEIYLAEQEPGTPDHSARVRLLGHALLMSRASAEAARTLAEAVRLSEAADSFIGQDHSRAHLGMALAYLGRFDEAESLLRRPSDGRAGPSPRAAHMAMRNLGATLRMQGRHQEALGWLEKAVEQAARHHNHRGDLAQGLLEAGLTHLELGATAAAQAAFARADTLYRDVHQDRMTPARADLLMGQARVQLAARNPAEALPLLEAADHFWREFDPGSRWAGEAARWLAAARRHATE